MWPIPSSTTPCSWWPSKSQSFFSSSNYQWEIFRILKWRYVSTIYGRYLQFRSLKWPLKLGNLTQSSHPNLQLAGVCRHRLSPPCRSRSDAHGDAMGTPWGVKKDGTFPMETWWNMVKPWWKHGETWWNMVDFGGFWWIFVGQNLESLK